MALGRGAISLNVKGRPSRDGLSIVCQARTAQASRTSAVEAMLLIFAARGV